METEAEWIRHVVLGPPRRRSDPAALANPDAVLAAWEPLRAASAALALSDEERRSRRPLPWDAAETVSVEEVVWHVGAHDQYHRGQVFTRLGLLGGRDLPDHGLIRAPE